MFKKTLTILSISAILTSSAFADYAFSNVTAGLSGGGSDSVTVLDKGIALSSALSNTPILKMHKHILSTE